MSNVSKCFFCANKKDYDAEFGYFGCAYSGKDCKEYSMFEPKVKPKPKTNADRLRSMTDERLAVEMYAKGGCPHDCETPDDIDTDCVQCWLDWLKEEAKS